MRKYLLMAASLLAGTLTAGAQTNYVFYNATYGYLYNDNGTLTSATALQFDKSSVWTASGNLSTSESRTIQSYTDGLYLGYNGALSTSAANDANARVSGFSHDTWSMNSQRSFFERSWSAVMLMLR